MARASETALRGALKLALSTIDLKASAKASNRKHKLAAAVSGALGGAFGLAALLVELPISTTILLRSIAEIAREEGEDLNAPNAAFACVEVFALGGKEDEEAAFESSYFAVRAALAKSVSDCARFVAQQGLGAHSVPVAARLISQIAARFGVVVSEKLAAQAAPISGGDRRRDGQCRLRRPFPNPRARPFRRPAPGARARHELGRLRVSTLERRVDARALGGAASLVVSASFAGFA